MAVDIATLEIQVKSNDVPTATDRLKNLTAEGAKAEKATGRLGASFAAAAKYIQAAAVALGAYKLAQLVKESALLAARFETLGVVMKVVGNNAGYTGKQMQDFSIGLQKQGIAMVESRQTLIMMAQAQIDLANAQKLGRIAQDAAVIGQINSSEAFQRMIYGIQSGQTEVLKTIGINVNFENSYKKLAAQLGKNKADLTEVDKTQARVNSVMEAGERIAGTYEASMGTAGKQITSMQRYISDLKVVLGETFNDALTVAVSGFTDGLKEANTEAERLQREGELKKWGRDLVDVFAFVADGIRGVLTLVATLTGAVIAGMQQLAAFGGVVRSLYSLDFKGAWGGMKDMGNIGAAYVDDMRQRWGNTIDNSFQGQAARMYAERNKNAGSGEAAAGIEAGIVAVTAAVQKQNEAIAATEADGAGKRAKAARKAEDELAAIRKQYADNALRLMQIHTQEKLAQLAHEKDMGLKTTQGYLDSKYALEKGAAQRELVAAQQALSNAKAGREYVQALGEVEQAKARLASVDNQKTRDDEKHASDVQRYRDEMNIQKLELQGRQLAALDARNALKYKDLKKQGYTEEEIGLQKVNDELDKQNRLREEHLAVQREIDALQASNDAMRASMVGTNEYGGFDSIADETANKLAVQKDAHEKRMKQIKAERDAELEKLKTTLNAEKSYREKIAKWDETLSLERQANEKRVAAINQQSVQSQLGMVSMYVGMASALFVALADTQDQSSRKGFETAKAFNIAAAIMSTAAGVMSAFAAPDNVTMVQKIASAAMVAITGAIQVAKIASTSFGGGGGSVASVPGFSGGGAGMGGSVGGSIGAPTLSVADKATEASMQRLAVSANSASLALGRVADGMTVIADLFESDQSKLLSGSLMSSRSGASGVRISGTESDLNIVQQMKLSGTTQAVGQGLSDTIQGYIRQIQSTIIRSAVVMGTSADMDSISIPTGKIRTDTNQSTKIQKQFEEWLAKVADKLAQTTAGLIEFTYYGESAFDAIVRLSTALQNVNDSLDLIGGNLITSTLAGANAAYQLQELMGGTEDFTEKVSGYFETMFSEEEQEAMKAEQARRKVSVAFSEMNSVVNDLNWTVPTTRKEFVGLVNSLDLTTDNGRSLFAALMDISDEFDTVQTQMEKVAQAAKELATAQNELNDSLSVRSLRLSGSDSMADLLEKVLGAESEIAEAREQGLNVTRLERIAYDEIVKYVNDEYLQSVSNYNTALENFNSTLVENARKVQTEWQNSAKAYEAIADSLKQTRLSLLTGTLSSGSLEDRLRESKTQLWTMYGSGMRGDQDSLKGLSSAVNSYLQLAQQYYASSPAYAVEYDTVIGMLQSAEGKATSQIDYAQRQADLQQKTIDALQKSDEERTKENAALLRENVAQTQALMEGFRQMIAIVGKSGGNLEQIESVLVQKAAA